MALKWIISKGNEFRLANVQIHREMITRDEEDRCKGGGYFTIEEGFNLILYSSSMDFGQVTKEEFENMYVRPALKRRFRNIFFSKTENIDTAISEYREGKLPVRKL